MGVYTVRTWKKSGVCVWFRQNVGFKQVEVKQRRKWMNKLEALSSCTSVGSISSSACDCQYIGATAQTISKVPPASAITLLDGLPTLVLPRPNEPVELVCNIFASGYSQGGMRDHGSGTDGRRRGELLQVDGRPGFMSESGLQCAPRHRCVQLSGVLSDALAAKTAIPNISVMV